MKPTGSKLRSRLGAIEQRMAVLESEITLLRKEREEVLEDLAAIVYPVLILPSDITSEIFLQWYGHGPPQINSLYPPSPLLLTSICRTWRAIALSTCRLWTSLICTSPSSARANLQCWLTHAGTLPVDLTIKVPTSSSRESQAIFRILAQYSSRWRSLNITSDGPISIPVEICGSFSSLMKISLNIRTSSDAPAETPSFLNAPHLREASLTSGMRLDWQKLPLWTQLTTLHLWFHDVDDALEILAHTPNLEVLIFDSESLNSPPDPLVYPPRILHRLHTIKLGSESGPLLLDYLILPSLEHIHLGTLTRERAD
ncbi:hypothetical protein C8R44DRAFT_868956 [Mycena epipterygia]|nr:hypothetical protein C8R44DRAFT_868956 [Mycena epipterygia]